MQNNQIEGAAANSSPSPHAPLQPVVSRGVATGQARGRFGGKMPARVDEETPWREYAPTLAGEDIARAAEELPAREPYIAPEVQALRDKVNRRERLHRFIRNAGIALAIAVVLYFAGQFIIRPAI